MSDATTQTPLRPVELLVLLVLVDGPLHGYGLVQRIEEETDGSVRLVPGNLYPVLRRLEEHAWIAESEKRPAADLDDARRRYYRVTDQGLTVLRSEVERMERLVRSARHRRLLRTKEQR
jgi:DNA-binding PadR family transcriptional regulator